MEPKNGYIKGGTGRNPAQKGRKFAIIKIVKFILAMVLFTGASLSIPATWSQAGLSPEQMKSIEERRELVRKRNIDLLKDRRKRSESIRKRYEQLRREEIKKDKDARKNWKELKKMWDTREKERRKRLPSNRTDWKKRTIERRKGHRDRLFRK